MSMGRFRAISARARRFGQSSGGGSVAIPDVAAPSPSAVVSGATFPTFNTTSPVQSFLFKWDTAANTIVHFNREVAGEAAGGLTKSLRVSLQNNGRVNFVPYNGGVAQFSNATNEVMASVPPTGTNMQCTRAADGSITTLRLDTGENITNTLTATRIQGILGGLNNLNTVWAGTFISAVGGVGMAGQALGDAIPLTVNSLSVDLSFRPTVDISYTGSGKTGYRIETRYSNIGNIIHPKTDAVVTVVTPGRLTLTAPINWAAEQYGTQVFVRIYEVVNGVETGVSRDTQPYTMPAAAVVPLTVGYNLQGALYYNPVPMASDIGQAASIRPERSILIPYAGINGTYTITTDPGYTLSVYQPNGKMTMLSSNASTGVHRAQITGDNNPEIGDGGNQRGFIPSGSSVCTSFSMIRDGSTSIVNPDWLTNSAFGAGIRDLDICGANYTPLDPTVFIGVADLADNLTLPLKAFAEKHAIDPNYRIYHHAQFLVADDALVTRDATAMRDTFPNNATAKFIHELSNETWSTGFPALARAGVEGARMGFLNGGTAENPTTKYPIIKINLPVNPNEAGPVYNNGQGASPALNTGECVWMNVLGSSGHPLTNVSSYTLLRALRPVAAGSDFTIGPDFELIATAGQLTAAALVYQGYKQNRDIEIYRTVLGNERYERQVLPGIYTQTGSDPRNQNTRLAATTGYANKVKILGTSFYQHHPDTTYLATSGLTPTILAQQWLDVIPANEQKLVGHIAIMRTMGNYQFGLYEYGCHPMIYARAADQIAHYIATWNVLEKSTLLGAVEWEIQKALMRVGSGYCFYYTGVGGTWGLKRDWSTVNSQYRLAGHLAAINGQARPAFV